MKKKRRKIISIILSAVLLLSGLLISPAAKVSAATQAEAVAWANAQIGKGLDYDGMYGNQCVDLIKYYYAYFGVAGYAMGNANNYITNSLPAGWSRVYGNYQPGDVAVWKVNHSCGTCSTGEYGHVGIITSADSVGFNAVSQNNAGVNTCTQKWFNISALACAIRPNFSEPPKPAYHNPEGYVDVAEGISGGIYLAGWALDKDNPAANLDIHVYIGGEAGSATAAGYPIKANKHRPDVGYGNYHGFEDTILTNKYGQQSVYVYALNIGGGNNVCLGSYTVNIKKPDSEAPKLEGCDITDLNDKGYTVTCSWSDNIGVTKVEFPTWDAETQSGSDATWYQGTSAEAGKTYSTWKFTFSKAETGKKYFTHIYAWDAAGNRTCFPLTRTTPTAMPIEPKNDTTAPVFENVALTQEKEGTVTLSVELSDDTGLGKLSRPGGRFLWYSADKNSSYLGDYYTGITSNINCWNGNGGSVPIVEKKYTGEETTSVQCDSIVGYGIMAQDLSGNYAVGNQLFNNEYIRYQIRSGNIKGQKNKSIEITLNQGEEITLETIRQKLSHYNKLDGFDVYFDAKNERILKKSNHPDSNSISYREEEKKVILTANGPGTEYVYFLNLLTGGLCSCKITVMPASCKLGDVYQDGKIDGKDVSLLLQCRLKKRDLTEEEIAAGDVYADGKIDGKDVSKLLQYRLGKISSLE